MPDAMKVDGKSLILNGMGVREVTFLRVDVYVAGLYLEKRSDNAEAIIGSEQVKRLHVVMLRDVERNDAITAWRKSIQENGADMAKLGSRFDQFASWLGDLKEGDRLSFLYVPGRGVSVAHRGKHKGTIAGADFAAALFSIWLGAHPADGDLKRQLLGND